MAVTQKQAQELLDKYGWALEQLEEGVEATGGRMLDDVDDEGSIFKQQVASVVLRALESIANDITFRPTLLKEKGKLPIQKHAFIEGDFGTPPDPNICLRKIFANLDNAYPEYMFKQLRDAFLREDGQEELKKFHQEMIKLTFTADAPEGKVNLSLIRRLKERLSAKNLNPYFSAMNELIGYASSDIERDAMTQDKQSFKEIAKEMLECVKAIETMHNTGKVDKKAIRKRLKILGENIEDALEYLDNTHNFSLEGQANIKPQHASGERGLWNIFCYNLACLFRMLFTILSIGYFKHENPLAKKLGYGSFFIKTGMTVDEEKDVKTQWEKIEVLECTLNETRKTLASLTREISSLDQQQPNP